VIAGRRGSFGVVIVVIVASSIKIRARRSMLPRGVGLASPGETA
jgi:hypothetical protein